MAQIEIGDNQFIGGNNKCFIIAEIGQNHQGDIDIAKQLIDEAKVSGADCVKFQKTNLCEKFNKNVLKKQYKTQHSWGETYGEHKEHLEFSEGNFRELQRYARSVGIIFSASAMDLISFDMLVNMKLPFIKIGSGDSNNLLLIKYAASKNTPLIISTGMVDNVGVDTIYNTVSEHHKQFCLLHCVSSYPTPYEDCNLNVIREYKNKYSDIPIGYSGHELGISVALAAVTLGAKVIERHFTLNKSQKGTDHVCSLTPEEFKMMVNEIRTIEMALGNPVKRIVMSEKACIDKLQKCIVLAKKKSQGEIIRPGDITIKVADPKGVNAAEYDQILYKTLTCTKDEDEPLFNTDVS